MGINDFMKGFTSGLYTGVGIPSALPSYARRISEMKASYDDEGFSSLNMAGQLAGITLGASVGIMPYSFLVMEEHWFPAIIVCATTNVMSGTLSLGGLESVVDSSKNE